MRIIKNKNFTVVEMGQQGFTILQSKGMKSIDDVTFCAAQSTLGMDDAAISKEIAAVFKKNRGWRGGDQLCVVLPRRFFILKNFIFPTHADTEIKKMLALQLSAHIPYKEEETVWDYVILEKMSDGYSRVLLIAVSAEVILKYLKIFSSQNMYPMTMTLSSWGLVGWLRFITKSAGTRSSAVHMILYMESATTEICFCDTQRFYFSRQITLGSADLERGGIKDLLEQINLTMTAYTQEKMGPAPMAGLILASTTATQILQDNLKGMFDFTMTPQNPAQEIASRRNHLKPQQNVLSLVGASVIGLGMLEVDLNDLSSFLPPNLRSTQDMKAKFQRGFKTMMFVCVAILSLGMALGVHVYEKTRELARIRERIRQVAPSTQRAQGQLRQWDAIRSAIIGRTPVVDFFDELARVTPREIVLTNVRLASTGEVTLQGQSFNPLAVNEFQRKLVSSPWLKNVTLQDATKRMVPGGEVTNFLITAVIKKRTQTQ